MNRYVALVALGLILLLAAALRLYAIGSVPTELDQDEIDLYNSAYSIATTGHDIDGKLLPFVYAPASRHGSVYAIAAYASSLIFGRTPLGLRLPAAVFGVIAVLLLCGIAVELTRRVDVALVAGLLMATQPIFVHLARIGWEPASELPFLLGGLYLLLRALRSSTVSIPLVFAGSFVLGLTAYTYMGGWFYALLLGGVLLTFNLPRFASLRGAVTLGGACAIWLLVAAPALWMWFFDEHTVNHTLGMATFAGGFTASAMQTFFANYVAHFRWSYLVTTGDPEPGITWRYLNGMGAFFGWVVPTAALGLALSARYILPLSASAWTWLWLAAYPLGGALTNQGTLGTPNAPRTLAGAPVFCILSAIGIAVLVHWAASLRWPRIPSISRSSAYRLVAIAVIFSTVYFARFYFTDYVHQDSNAWFSGTRTLFTMIRESDNSYRRVCFNLRRAWFPLASFARFYLNGVPLRVIDGIDDPRCSLTGTLLVVDPDYRIERSGFYVLAKIDDVDRNPFATLRGNR